MLPKRLSAIDKLQKAGVVAREEFGDVAKVSTEEVFRFGVARRVHHLRKVDQGQPRGRNEDIEGGKVAVNHARSEEPADLHEDFLVQQSGHFEWNVNVGQARRDFAVVVTEVFHEQDVAAEKVGFGDANAALESPLERIVLHRPPTLFEQLPSVLGLLLLRALVAGVAGLVAALDVTGDVLKRSIVAGLVDFGRD